MTTVKILPLFLLALCMLTLPTTSRIVEITSSNIQLVLRSLQSFHLLLNNPQCPHSHSYTQKYLTINSSDHHLAISDCTKDPKLCQYMNVTQYPSLFVVSSH